MVRREDDEFTVIRHLCSFYSALFSPEKCCVQKKEGEEERAPQQVSMPTDNGDALGTSEAPVEVSTSGSSGDHRHYQKADKSASPLETSGSTTQRASRQGSFSRSTHSALLQEGESHEVWRPGCQRSRYNRSRGTIADRQKSLLMRISSYRSASCGLDATPEVGVGSWRTRGRLEEEDREKRLSQWKRIEEDAMGDGCLSELNWSARRVPPGEEDAGGEGRRPESAHHVLPCRDSSLFPSTSNLSSTYASMPDVSASMVATHPPPQSCLDGCGVPQGAPTESQTLPRKLHLCAERRGEEEVGSSAAPQGAPNGGDIEQSDLEEENRRALWRLQRHTSSPHPTTPPRCYPSYAKRESFAEMVPIPEEEAELSMSLHGRLPSSGAHVSLARAPCGSSGEPLGGDASSSSHAPYTGVTADENVPAPSSGDSRTHQGSLLVQRGKCLAVTNLGGHGGGVSSQPQREGGGPSPVHNLPVGPQSHAAVPRESFNPVAIIGLQESPGRQSRAQARQPSVAPNNAAGRGPQARQPSVAPGRYSTCVVRTYKQTDV